MVVKRAAATAGAGAGGFAGGFLNNPGALAAIGIVVTIVTTLLVFRKDISEFFSGLGKIEFPDITLPDITFPDFPDITFPDFPDITFPEFPDFGSIFENFFNQFGGGGTGGLPLPPDVEDIGLLTPEERAACGCGTNIIQDIQGDVSETCITPCDVPEEGDPGFIGPIQPDEPFMLPEIEPTPLFTGLEDVEITGGGAVFADPITEPFAVTNIEETQEEFQERSAAFAEAFPTITESTSLPGGEIIFGVQLSRESEDFQTALEQEAARSESIFAALFGNVQNPEFGA